MNGIDTTDNATTEIPCLQHNGIGFVFRYVSPNADGRQIVKPEALALSKVGIAIACVYEMLPYSDAAKVAHFTFSQGLADGKYAYQHLENVLQAPAGAAVYFAIDYDTSEKEDDTIIAAYFAGVRRAFFEMGIEGSLVRYHVGAYASGATLDFLFTNGLIDFKWVTLSQGFRGSRGYAGWDVRQIEEKTVCGLDADTNEAKDDFGQFFVTADRLA